MTHGKENEPSVAEVQEQNDHELASARERVRTNPNSFDFVILGIARSKTSIKADPESWYRPLFRLQKEEEKRLQRRGRNEANVFGDFVFEMNGHKGPWSAQVGQFFLEMETDGLLTRHASVKKGRDIFAFDMTEDQRQYVEAVQGYALDTSYGYEISLITQAVKGLAVKPPKINSQS